MLLQWSMFQKLNKGNMLTWRASNSPMRFFRLLGGLSVGQFVVLMLSMFILEVSFYKSGIQVKVLHSDLMLMEVAPTLVRP